MKLDGVPPGVAATSSEFHHLSHHGDEPPDSTPNRCRGGAGSSGATGEGGGWVVPSRREEHHHQDLKIHHHHHHTTNRDCATATPQLEHDDRPPPMSVVVVRGMPPLPYVPPTSTTPERPGSHWEPAVARSYQPSNGCNVSSSHTGSEQMLSVSSFRLQPRTPTVTRSNRGGCRGRKRTAGGMMNLGSNSTVPSSTIRPGCVMTVNTQHHLEESASCSRAEVCPEVGLGLVDGSHPLISTDVAVTPSSEPRSPHVLDSALITLRSLSIRSPGGPTSPSLHDIMLNASPNSIKRPRGSSFSVYTSSPAGSLPSASSTRPSTTCNSARSSPRVVPLTVLMADTSCSSAQQQPGASTNEIKTPSRPPFLGVVKLPRDSQEKRSLDKRSAAVSFESPMSANGFGTSPTTPLPRISLTPRSSSTSRESSFPVFPSPACLDFDDDNRNRDVEEEEEQDGLPKFWLNGASPILAPTPNSTFDHKLAATVPLSDPGRHFESMMPRASPRQESEMLVPPPPLKYPLTAVSKFHHYGSSNSLALSADGSQDLNGQQQYQHQQYQSHMSPMDDSRPYTNSFLPFPHWLGSNHSRSIRGIQESPGTPLSSDSVPGSTDLPTPQHSNSRKLPSFPFGIDEGEEPMFCSKSQSLLHGPPLLSTRHLLVHQTMYEPEVNYSMDADTGSLSDSEDDEPFLLVSPKEIAEERLQSKRARLRRRWIGDKSSDGTGSRRLSVSSEGASNTSLFGMDIPHDEPSVNRLSLNPNSISATSFPSQNPEDASEPSSLCRRRSDGSLGSLGLSLELMSANNNQFHATTSAGGCAAGRDLVTPPILPTSKATELSPPPFAPKQDPMLMFAEASIPTKIKPCFLSRRDQRSTVDCQGPLYDGGVDDDDDEASDSHSMDEE